MIKIDKKFQKKELDALVESANINKDSTLILACIGDADFKSMESSFTAKQNACAVRFFALMPNEAIGFYKMRQKD